MTALSESATPAFTAHDFEAARRVLSDSAAWLVPAADGEACLVRLVEPLVAVAAGQPLPPTVSFACLPEQQAQAGRLVETQSLAADRAAADRYRVVGIAPDGVRNLRIVTATGADPVDPVRNAYEAIVPRPLRVAFLTASGERRVVDIDPGGEAHQIAGGRP